MKKILVKTLKNMLMIEVVVILTSLNIASGMPGPLLNLFAFFLIISVMLSFIPAVIVSLAAALLSERKSE